MGRLVQLKTIMHSMSVCSYRPDAKRNHAVLLLFATNAGQGTSLRHTTNSGFVSQAKPLMLSCWKCNASCNITMVGKQRLSDMFCVALIAE